MFFSLFQRIRTRLLRERTWCIGFIEATLDDVLAGCEVKVVPMKGEVEGRWFADPFILRADDNEIVLLVEDYDTQEKKGRISKLTIAREGYQLKQADILLDLPNHLSFPYIIQREGEVYFMPESLRNNGLTIYRLDEAANTCEEVRTLTQTQLSDAIFAHFIGDDCLIATEYPNDGNRLCVFKENTQGNFMFHHSFHFPNGTARNAGDFFRYGTRLFRPAQDCGSYYGKGVVIQEVTWQDNQPCFREVRRLYSPDSRYPSRLHTFNVLNDTMVVDMADWDYPQWMRTVVL